MINLKKQFALLFLTLTLLTALPAQSEGENNILVLHSYHKGLEWTDNITRGIQSVINDELKTVEIYYEYIDTKRYSLLRYSNEQTALFMSKYPSGFFDVIITADNDALKFAKESGPSLFSSTPVVFCGINNYSPKLISGMKQVTGVVETTDYKKTLELMAKIHPDAENIIIIIDKTSTGMEIKKEFHKIIPFFKGRFTFEFYQDFLLEEIKYKISKSGPKDLIYLLTFNRDRNNNFISYANGIKILNEASTRPVYVSWDFYMGKGILGGIITSGFDQGSQAAIMALKILNGISAKSIPVNYESPNKCIFNYRQMKRFGIKKSQLSSNCQVINVPPSFYDQHKRIISTAAFLAILISGILLWNLRIQRQKQKLLIQLNEQLNSTVKNKTFELIEASRNLNSVIDTAPSPVFYKDTEGKYQGCNDSFADIILGLPKKKIIGYSLHDMPDRIPANLARRYHEKDVELIKNPGTQLYEARVMCADNNYRDFFFNKATLFDVDGNVSGIVGVMLDISERKKIENELMESKERFKRLLEASFGGVIIHEKGHIIDVNQELTDISGYTQDELRKLKGLDLIAPEWRDKVLNRVLSRDEALYDVEGLKKDGTRYPLEIQEKIIPFEGRLLRVTGLRDITERIEAQKEKEKLIKKLQQTNEKLEKLSITDVLTGLNNRRYIFDRFIQEMSKAKRYDNSLSIILIDIDNFKHLNDTYGHPFGDEVLKKISHTFKNTIRETDMIGRYGGEEFLFVLPNTDLEQGALLGERLREAIEALTWDQPHLTVTISGGLVQYYNESDSEFLKSVDTLLYRAKSLGKNRIEST